MQTLGMAGIRGFEGILNGTSNFVLDRMGDGLDLGAAVKEAQTLGYAEADPTADIEGYDVRLKVVIMANELLGADISPEDVNCQGISGLTLDNILAASAAGQRRKSSRHPFANIGGATNAISFKTELLGDVSVAGPGAGRLETAFALLSDIIAIYRG
jgi:homoserine dehydrogenase